MRTILLVVCLAVAVPAYAQNGPPPQDEWQRERDALATSCGDFDLGAMPACSIALATQRPVHVSLGTIAPQNRVGFGPSIAGHATPGERWRINWSADAVVAAGGAWRAGTYVNFLRANGAPPANGPATRGPVEPLRDRPAVYATYWQTIALDKLLFFGLGPAPTEAAESIWTMHQTIVGGRAIVPLNGVRALGLSVTGAVNGRWFDIGGRSDGDTPSIEDVFPPRDIPGLGDERRFVQFSEGVRLEPSLGARVEASYQLAFDQFVSDEDRSFSRWTIELRHDVPFGDRRRTPVRDAMTPNQCATSAGDACGLADGDRSGAVSLRIVNIGTDASGSVPFYLQPTLGGADINGAYRLTSFRDYWFRAPHVLALQLAVEHTLANIRFPRNVTIPIGGFMMAEQGKAAESFRDLFQRFAHSYATGLTVRGGGFPQTTLMFAWGHEGHRWSVTISPSLFGGGERPRLD